MISLRFRDGADRPRRVFLNELALADVWTSTSSVHRPLSDILQARRRQPVLRDALYCARGMAGIRTPAGIPLSRAAQDLPRDTRVQLFEWMAKHGPFIEDDRYVVERFQAMVDGDIRRSPGDEKTAKGRRKATRTTVSLKNVQALRPARNEIIVCTGLRIRGSGIQYWVPWQRGSSATPSRSVERRSPDVPPAPRRPGVPRLDSNPGRETPRWPTRTLRFRRARDLERYHRRPGGGAGRPVADANTHVVVIALRPPPPPTAQPPCGALRSPRPITEVTAMCLTSYDYKHIFWR